MSASSSTTPFTTNYSSPPASPVLEAHAHTLAVAGLVGAPHGFARGAASRVLPGLLPSGISSLETEVVRALAQLRSYAEPLQKYVYLSGLAASSSAVFYALLLENLEEVMPLVYTPTVGAACVNYSHIAAFHPTGLFITPEHRGQMRAVLDSWLLPVHIIVVTDGSRILGLGDLGAGGMGIPVGKLALYVAAGGFHPSVTLPVTLDFGTNNEDLLADPLYIGYRHKRVDDDTYYALVHEFVLAVKDKWPAALLQFEDISNNHCFTLLDKYRPVLPCFNDDIQGTGAVVAAGFVVAARVLDMPISEHRCVFMGAGSAAVGVADRIVSLMVSEGCSEEEARARFWFVDSRGLVVKGVNEPLASHKIPYARTDIDPSGEHLTSLMDIVKFVKPTALVGLSGTPGVFTADIIAQVAAECETPLVFPLSNPTSKAECTAETAYMATEGRCLFASGSPFDPVTLADGTVKAPGQANNMYCFPGMGMGAVLSRAAHMTEPMLNAAVLAVADSVNDDDLALGRIYPSVDRIRDVSARVAAGVAAAAVEDGVSEMVWDGSLDELAAHVKDAMYVPDVVPHRCSSRL